jgi:hypothetical protein
MSNQAIVNAFHYYKLLCEECGRDFDLRRGAKNGTIICKTCLDYRNDEEDVLDEWAGRQIEEDCDEDLSEN